MLKMIKWFEGLLEERERVRRVVAYLIIIFGAGLIFSIVSKFAADTCNWISYLNKIDTFFALIVGVLTIISLIMAFLSIRGLFERIGSLTTLLREASKVIKEVPTGKEFKIMGYYITFGIVTLGHKPEWDEFVNSLEDALKEEGNRNLYILELNVEDRYEVLQKYCRRYGYQPEAIQKILDILEKSNSFHDLIKDIGEKWRTCATQEAGDIAGLIFNIYNEYLLQKISSRTKIRDLSLQNMPDYHAVFSPISSGVIFIPLTIPEVEVKERSQDAQIVGWRTVDQVLLNQLDRNFQYYFDKATDHKVDDAIKALEEDVKKYVKNNVT
jgi:hypothetical protein